MVGSGCHLDEYLHCFASWHNLSQWIKFERSRWQKDRWKEGRNKGKKGEKKEGEQSRSYSTMEWCVLSSNELSITERVQTGIWWSVVRDVAEETDEPDDLKGHFQYSEARIPPPLPCWELSSTSPFPIKVTVELLIPEHLPAFGLWDAYSTTKNSAGWTGWSVWRFQHCGK